jgi:hypothetical protein
MGAITSKRRTLGIRAERQHQQEAEQAVIIFLTEVLCASMQQMDTAQY